MWLFSAERTVSMKVFAVKLVIILCVSLMATAFNIDSQHPLVFGQDKQAATSSSPTTTTTQNPSLFGYSVALSVVEKRAYLYAGAPQANSSLAPSSSYRQPGALYRCDLGQPRGCSEIPVDRSDDNQTVKDGALLGASVDAQVDGDKRVVVCAPRFTRLITQSTSVHRLVNGACFVNRHGQTDDGFVKLIPLSEISRQYVTLKSEVLYFFSLGQVGVSVHFSDNHKILAMGAPGVTDWTGAVVHLSLNANNFGQESPESQSQIYAPNPTEGAFHRYSYLGYAISSGLFYPDMKISFLIGAPRANVTRGKVFLLHFSKQKILIQAERVGTTFGELFGSSVLALDLNGDGLCELIVGAPFYSGQTKSGGDGGETVSGGHLGYNVGRVYIFKNFGNGTIDKKAVFLYGSGGVWSRFGASLSRLYDVDLDGFEDFAVGEPYGNNGRGIVYIFRGDSDLVSYIPSQVINAERFSTLLRGFGYSLSRGVDIDGNNYPDLAVGAPISGHVVVLRSKPVIRFNATLSATPHLLDTSVEKLNLSACFNYSGAFVPKTLKLNVIVKDNSSHKDSIVTQNGELININQTLEVNIISCLNFPVNLKLSNMTNFASPLKFHLKFNIVSNETESKNDARVILPNERNAEGVTRNRRQVNNRPSNGPFDRFCRECPIINPHLPEQKEIFLQVPFSIGCGSDGECQTDLKVSAFPVNQIYIIGSGKYITLQIHVNNLGEAASLPLLELNVPNGLSLVQMPRLCGMVRGLPTISCRIFPNPFYSTSLYNQSFEFDTTDLDQWPINMAEQRLQFNMSVSSNSLEQNQDDNQFSTGLVLQRQANVDIFGHTSRDVITLGGPKQTTKTGAIKSNFGSDSIRHEYSVVKRLLSPLHSVSVALRIPIAIITDSGTPVTIAHLNQPSAFINSQPLRCSSKDEILYRFNEKETVNQTSLEFGPVASVPDFLQATFDSTLDLNCQIPSKVRCVHIICDNFSMSSQSDIGTFTLSLGLNVTTLQSHLSAVDRVFVTTTATVYIDDFTLLEDGTPAPRNRETSVITQVLLPDLQPQRQPVWIFIASVVGAFIVLFILTYGLNRLGFFRRKKLEELQLLKDNDYLYQ